MPRYWECPACRALLTRERLEAAAGVCPYCDARVGPPADFTDPDAPPAESEGARRLPPIEVPVTVGGKLATAARLLVEQLPLIVSLVVLFKLPANAGLEIILERRAAGGDPLARGLLKRVVELFFDPITTAAVLVALNGRMAGRATPFRDAVRAGLDSWWWLFAAQLVKQLTIVIVALGLFIPELGPARIVLAIPTLVLVVRYALVDEAVVLDHTPVLDSRRRSSELVTGRAWQVVRAGIGSMAAVLLLALLAERWAERLHLMEDPLMRGLLVTLFDVLAVYNTIVLFLIYWEARNGPGGDRAVEPAPVDDRS